MVEATVKGIIRQTIFVLLFAALVQIGAGSVLSGMTDDFSLLPGLIVMVPALLGLRGNISGSLASRLGTALHSGVIKPHFSWNPELRNNVLSSLFLTFVMSINVGVFAFLVASIMGASPMALWIFLAIALIAGLLAGIVTIVMTIAVAFSSFRRGWDPDNITSPVMSTVNDFLIVVCIYIAVIMVGWV